MNFLKVTRKPFKIEGLITKSKEAQKSSMNIWRREKKGKKCQNCILKSLKMIYLRPLRFRPIAFVGLVAKSSYGPVESI